jgi:hypothetical protein
VDARRGCSNAALNREKRFGDGHGDFVIGVRHHTAITFDHTQLTGRGAGYVEQAVVGLAFRGRYRYALMVSVFCIYRVRHLGCLGYVLLG